MRNVNGFFEARATARRTSSAPGAAEPLANSLVGCVCDCESYRNRLHVRQVLPWIGFVLKAIERIPGGTLRGYRKCRIQFDYRGHHFRGGFEHKVGPTGGLPWGCLQIVEVLPRQGAPHGRVAVTITCLGEAEDVYHTLEERLDNFIDVQ